MGNKYDLPISNALHKYAVYVYYDISNYRDKSYDDAICACEDIITILTGEKPIYAIEFSGDDTFITVEHADEIYEFVF